MARDRDGSFEPVVVPKRSRRLSGFEDQVLSLYANGFTTGDIVDHVAEIYGDRVSKDLCDREPGFRVTDAVVGEMNEWRNRPLDDAWFLVMVANGLSFGPLFHELVWCAIFETQPGLAVEFGCDSVNLMGLTVRRSVVLGKYWRSSPLVFSLVPLCQGDRASAK